MCDIDEFGSLEVLNFKWTDKFGSLQNCKWTDKSVSLKNLNLNLKQTLVCRDVVHSNELQRACGGHWGHSSTLVVCFVSCIICKYNKIVTALLLLLSRCTPLIPRISHCCPHTVTTTLLHSHYRSHILLLSTLLPSQYHCHSASHTLSLSLCSSHTIAVTLLPSHCQSRSAALTLSLPHTTDLTLSLPHATISLSLSLHCPHTVATALLPCSFTILQTSKLQNSSSSHIVL